MPSSAMIGKKSTSNMAITVQSTWFGSPASTARASVTPATDSGKMCMLPAVLQGKFCSISVFGRSLEERLGGMNENAAAGLFAEHCMAADSDVHFTPTNHPTAGRATTPREEFRAVVGAAGVDTKTWTLRPDAAPTCPAGGDVPGRVLRPLAYFLGCAPAHDARLTRGEVVALRLFTGPMYARYNEVLREASLRDPGTAGLEVEKENEVNTYSTTIGLIISGLIKLGRIATVPRNTEGTAIAFRGLAGLHLPPAFFTPDEQGFCGVVEPGFLSLSDDKAVAAKYSGVEDGKVSCAIFELELGKASLGAEVAWLSQFPHERERLLPPWTHLQVVGAPTRRADGVTVVRMRPTVFQNVRTVEEVAGARKEEVIAHIIGLMRDLRNRADLDGSLDSGHAQRLAAFEQHLLERFCKYEPKWYHDNGKYKSTFLGVLREVEDARPRIADPASALSRQLASAPASAAGVVPPRDRPCAKKSPEVAAGESSTGRPAAKRPAEGDGPAPAKQAKMALSGDQDAGIASMGSAMVGAKPSSNLSRVPASAHSSNFNEVAALHSKFFQDPSLFQNPSQSFRANLGSDDAFAGGIQGKLGRMGLEYVKDMYLEHNHTLDAETEFKTYNAGHVLITTAKREWEFVVGSQGVDLVTWTFDLERAEPKYTPESMVEGRNATPLRELMQLPLVKKAGLRVAEVVAIRLYAGPLYNRYNRVLRELAANGDTLFPTTIYLIRSAQFKIAMITTPPPDLTLYRGTGNMALGPAFFGCDEQGCAGGVELGFMSATRVREVAMGYAGACAESGKATKDLPTLYVIRVDKMSIGANIADLSQFEGEEEHVYPPLTLLEVDKEPELSPDGKVSQIHLKITVNQRSTTVEDAEESRRRFLVGLARSLQWSLKNWARQHAGLTQRLGPQMVGVLQSLLGEVRDAELTVLNTNQGYAQVFDHIMSLWEEALMGEVVEVLWQDGRQEAEAGHTDAAVQRFEQAIDAAVKVCANSKEQRDRVVAMRRVVADHNVASSFNNIARIYEQQGKYEEALEMHAKSIEIKTRVHGSGDHLNVADSWMNIGKVCQIQGKYGEALESHTRSLDIKLKLLGSDDPDVAASYSCIGSVYKNQGQYEKALEYYHKALEIDIKASDHHDLSVAKAYGNIGVVYKKQGKYGEALESHTRSLDIKLKLLGSEDPDVAASYSCIGSVYKNQGQYEQALEYYHKALEIGIKASGHHDLSVADSLMNIGNVYQSQSKYGEALESHTRSLDIKLKLLGSDDTDVAKSYFNIGLAYQKKSDLENALLQYKKAQGVFVSVHGNEHPGVAASKEKIGLVLKEMGKKSEAKQLFTEAAAIHRKVLGADHHLTKKSERLAAQ